MFHSITEAKLTWQNGEPKSELYGDQYFVKSSGLTESEYVFLQHNQLPERWRGCDNFVIGETGFGIGLNFFVACKYWLQTTCHEQTLTYISVELHPLSKLDFIKASQRWPELSVICQQVIDQFPPNFLGFHRLELFNGRIILLLLLGDANVMFRQLNAKIDAWFLDGFAPSKNNTMWSHKLFSEIVRLSKPETTFATFTAAGDVRRNLQAVGFDVKKSPGFGAKREMLFGSLREQTAKTINKPWYDISNILPGNKKELCIVGAGIAGLTTAYLFAEKGWKVTVIDKQSSVASGASGNPVGLVMPRLTTDMNRGARFFTGAFFNTARWLNGLQVNQGFEHWWQSGILHLMPDDKLHKLEKLQLPSRFATELAAADISSKYQINAKHGGLFYHQAGYVSPVKLCQFLYDLMKDRVEFCFSTEIVACNKKETYWQLSTNNHQQMHFENVVIAAANDVVRLVPDEYIKVTPVRGQISFIPQQNIDSEVNFPVVCENYLTPVVNNLAVLGASYEREMLALDLREPEHSAIVSQVQSVLPDLIRDDTFVDGRASLRCTTYDRLPIVGPIPDWEYYEQAYADLKHGKPASTFAVSRYQQGLYINTGHGSRGLVSSYNTAQLLYSIISKTPLFLENEIVEAMHPARFVIKKLKRG